MFDLRSIHRFYNDVWIYKGTHAYRVRIPFSFFFSCSQFMKAKRWKIT